MFIIFLRLNEKERWQPLVDAKDKTRKFKLKYLANQQVAIMKAVDKRKKIKKKYKIVDEKIYVIEMKKHMY